MKVSVSSSLCSAGVLQGGGLTDRKVTGLSRCVPLGLASYREETQLEPLGPAGHDQFGRERTQRAQRAGNAPCSLRSFAAIWRQQMVATPRSRLPARVN